MPILAITVGQRTIDQQCSNCGQTNLAQSFAVLQVTNPTATPGQSAIGYTCPNCGALEFFNTNLGPEDEGNEVRGLQARRIRALMVLIGVSRRNVAH